MRTFNAILLFVTLGFSAHADFPTEDRFGIGAMVGTLGSISGKFFLTDVDAVDLGVEFLGHPWQVFYGDYYRHFPKIFGKGTRFGRESSLYGAIGTGVGFWDRTDTCGRWHCTWNANTTGAGNGFFVRLVVGVEWYPRKTNYSVFGELGPSYMWYPTDGNTFDVGVGGRYYF
jgi:hypothetical protein